MTELEFNPSYTCRRDDVLKLIPRNAKKVLDVGCSVGTFGAQIKEFNEAEVTGIEYSHEMAMIAAQKLDNVIEGDIEEIINRDLLKNQRFDTIVFADVLEHLKDPWTVLNALVKYLEPNGCVVASIPNIRHIDAIVNLALIGRWQYNERGFYDKTHLRHFTKRSVIDLFKGAGMSIEKLRRNYRLIAKPSKINRAALLFAIPVIRNFFTIQYLVRAKFD